jgi:hypothetical protein
MRWLLVLPALALIGGIGSTSANSREDNEQARQDAKLAKLLVGLTPGKPQDCINLRDAQSTDRVGDKIIYKVSRKRAYVTDTGGGCFGLERGDIIVTHTYSGQLCRGDIAQTVEPVSNFHSGSCAIGSFTPYIAAK